LGAEILRLWVASTDYSGELSISDEILKRVTESYRRIRNTLRFLLANTSDFNPAKDAVALTDMAEIDRYAIARMTALQSEILEHYKVYEYHPVVSKLQMYCSEDLGGFYLDILKDRLYTCGTTSAARRSAQTAIWHITQSLLRVMAPILSFTAEEAWSFFANKDEYEASSETIFTQTYYELPQIEDATALTEKWDLIRKVRSEVNKALENLRTSGQIGSSLQAEVDIYTNGRFYEALTSLGEDLKFVLIVSSSSVKDFGDDYVNAKDGADLENVLDPALGLDLRMRVSPSTYEKCERCWHYRADVNADAAHPGICGRCVSNQFGAGESRKFA